MTVILVFLFLLGQPQGEEDRAVQELRAALEKQPDSAVLARSLGETLFRRNPNNPEAGELLKTAAKSMPGDAEARHYYAQWAYFNNREQVCADQEREALHFPGLNDASLLQMYTLSGFCENRLGNAKAAERAFEKAFEIDCREKTFDPAIAYRYLDFLVKAGRDSEAQQVASMIIERSHKFGPAHVVQAKLYEHGKKIQRAVDEAQLAIQGEGNDSQTLRAAHMILAKGYFALGDAERTKQEQDWIKAQIVSPAP